MAKEPGRRPDSFAKEENEISNGRLGIAVMYLPAGTGIHGASVLYLWR